jgi:hypothetical protein
MENIIARFVIFKTPYNMQKCKTYVIRSIAIRNRKTMIIHPCANAHSCITVVPRHLFLVLGMCESRLPLL